MPQMKMSYTEIRAAFIGTDYGDIFLELAVGRAKVIGKDKQGIKLTLIKEDVRESALPMLVACRESDPERFNDFCDKVENLEET